MFWVFVSYINKPKYVCRNKSKHAKVSDTLFLFTRICIEEQPTRLLFVSSKSNLQLKHLYIENRHLDKHNGNIVWKIHYSYSSSQRVTDGCKVE